MPYPARRLARGPHRALSDAAFANMHTYDLGPVHIAFANMPVRELFANTFVYQPAVRTPSFANSGVREPFASVCLP